jgi:hypothetical protein
MTKFALFGKKDLQRAEKRVDNFISSLPLVKKRRRWLVFLDFFNIFSYFVYSALIIIVIFLAFNFIVFKNVYSVAISGKNNLEASIHSSKNNDFKTAIANSEKAEKYFFSAKKGLEEIKKNYFLGSFKNFSGQLNDLEYLMSTGEILSRAVYRGSSLGLKLNEVMQGETALSYSKFSEEQKKQILKFIYESGPEIYGIKASLDLGVINLGQFEGGGVLKILNSKINELKEQLEYGSELLAKAVPLTEIIPFISGYPKQTNFLVVLQNNDELRPTGGFIGTYGVLQMNNGEIKDFKTNDIYHMDMPVKDKLIIEPPTPMKKYLIDRWYMRDANWSPDWPASARQIEWFYQKEYNLLPAKDKQDKFSGNFNGVIGITPSLASDLLRVIGPITIDGEEFNSQNFHDLLQYEVELGYATDGVSNWHRKEIIGNLFKEIKIKMLDLPSSRWQEMFKVFSDNFDKKNILVFFNDKRFEDYAAFLNWDGRMINTPEDYLMVVDANFGSFKTDAVVDKKITYKMEEGKDGFFSTVSLTYDHRGGFDWRTTKYRSYTRIYVPKGSILSKGQGDFEGEIEVGEEFDKSFFGLFITVEPGKSGVVNIQYKLPDNIGKQIKLEKKYRLLMQKQPGRNTNQLLVDLKFNNRVKSYKPTGFNVINNDQGISWNTDWETDKEFKVNF